MELLHRRCCGLDVHKETVVACLRLVADGKVTTEFAPSKPRRLVGAYMRKTNRMPTITWIKSRSAG